MGSSPLARGLPRLERPVLIDDRIIPARAGFTHVGSLLESALQDHPRSRGVYRSGSIRSAGVRGSSPLARGLRAVAGSVVTTVRIIPARAGFTAGQRPWRLARPDHPRSRGVYVQGRGMVPGTGGIIPARAGFTGQAVRSRVRRPDHPRSRGVYFLSAAVAGVDVGSSPLARGLPLLQSPQPPRLGIIPARAGFTPNQEDEARAVLGSSPLARGLHLEGGGD